MPPQFLRKEGFSCVSIERPSRYYKLRLQASWQITSFTGWRVKQSGQSVNTQARPHQPCEREKAASKGAAFRFRSGSIRQRWRSWQRRARYRRRWTYFQSLRIPPCSSSKGFTKILPALFHLNTQREGKYSPGIFLCGKIAKKLIVNIRPLCFSTWNLLGILLYGKITKKMYC